MGGDGERGGRDGLAARQLAAIAETVAAARTAGVALWLRGGWAMDFTLGEVTRPHVDVDWYCWRDDADRLAEALGGRGWRVDPRLPVDVQLELVRDDVELSVAYLSRDAAGQVVVGAGPWAGTPLPAGMLDAPPGRVGDLTAPVVSIAAQIQFKEMFPVWMPDRPRRPKDAADLARLRARHRRPE